MTELAKWVWIILLGILFGGWSFFVIIGICLVVGFLIAWLKPEWFNKM